VKDDTYCAIDLKLFPFFDIPGANCAIMTYQQA